MQVFGRCKGMSYHCSAQSRELRANVMGILWLLRSYWLSVFYLMLRTGNRPCGWKCERLSQNKELKTTAMQKCTRMFPFPGPAHG